MASGGKLCAAGATGFVAVVATTLALPFLALMGSAGSDTTGAVGGIPSRVLQSYRAVDGWCPGLRWQLVAAVGAIESGHASSGGATVDQESGAVSPPIFGVALDGSPGVRALPIGSRLGWFGLPGPWQRAVGPLQFLPGTFSAWAVDADGDGVASPHDIDDAVATAANYLCGGRSGSISDERSALRRYNNDEGYVAKVLGVADSLAATPAPIMCPVAGPTSFTDTWLAPRPGGRQHLGVDMFAAEGTPLVAPVSGQIELRDNALGGLTFSLWGDDGNYYYGAHMSRYANVAGNVGAGTVVGYVGSTGDAVRTPPHLHFEIHPGRVRGAAPRAVNPTVATAAACGK